MMRELEMNYIHEYLKKISGKIIENIQKFNETDNEIKIYEDRLIQFLRLLDNFFSFSFYGPNFNAELVIFSDELLNILVFSDNWDLINQIFLMLKMINSKSRSFYQTLNLKSRYI